MSESIHIWNIDTLDVGGLAFIPWLLAPGSMPRAGTRGQNLGHLKSDFLLSYYANNLWR